MHGHGDVEEAHAEHACVIKDEGISDQQPSQKEQNKPHPSKYHTHALAMAYTNTILER